MNNEIEILAPVGNKEMLKTAIAYRADAVYFGLENFNARAKADNFNSDTVRDDIKLCHLYGIKVYVTVNTLVSNNEFSLVTSMIEKAYLAKADAFIVQDIGLIYYLKQKFPNIEIHASTQCGVCNAYGASVLKKLGVKRVVVARETTLEDIKQIKELGLEVEVFVQGALCVCYSGSCYISSLLKNKSGNRGECLQLCRLPYKLIQNGSIKKEGYLLSTRDLSLLARIKDLKKVGVDSLKIEGRLRRPAYLAQAIKSVKSAINSQECIKGEDLALKKVFSRGDFNHGIYLDSKTNGGIINSSFNNHIGIKVGKVISIRHFKDIYEIKIYSTHVISKNDGLKFISTNSECSLGVGSVVRLGNNNYLIHSKVRPCVNDDVYLTVDSNNEEKLLNYSNKIKVSAIVNVVEGKPLQLEFRAGNITACVLGQIVQSAKTKPLDECSIKESIEKLGDTEFELENIKIVTKNAFVTKSELNNVRRECINLLAQKIVQEFEEKHSTKLICNDKIKFEKANFNNNFNLYIINNYEQLKDIKDKKARIVYAPSVYNISDIKRIKDDVNKLFSTKLYLYMPVVANNKDIEVLNAIINQLNKSEFGLLAGSIYGLEYANHGIEVFCYYNCNIANDFAVSAAKFLGASGVVETIERNIFDCLDYTFSFVGYPAVMTLVMCPFIENVGSSCKNCKFEDGYELVMDSHEKMTIRRQKISSCYFELISSKKINQYKQIGNIIDLRN